MSTSFDTLKTSRRLKEAGFNDRQAEELSEVFWDAQESRLETLATKSDLTELKGELGERIAKVEGRLSLVQWMLGFDLALTAAVLWMLIRSAGIT